MIAVLLLTTTSPLLEHLIAPLSLAEQVQNIPTLIFSVLEFSLAIICIALWRAAPDYTIFRTTGIFFAIVAGEQCWLYFGGAPSTWAVRCFVVIAVVQTAAEAMRIQKYVWTRFLWPLYIFAFIAGWFPSMEFVRDWPTVISQAAFGILIIQGFRFGDTRDRMIASVFTAYFMIRFAISTTFENLTGLRNYVMIGGWKWQITGMALLLMAAATLTIFVRDLIRDRREKLRLVTEVEAARTVQQILIPEDIPAIPGFIIQSVYRPFGEVGGDFFQIIPARGGRILVVIGDVSGKGMPAAMTVSLLVGTVRTLAHYTQSPAEILAAMNQRMLSRSAGGFTTCLVARIDADGTVTIANAGHLSPYRNGAELSLENGMPLGLDASAAYAESTIQLAASETLTLLTDGVIEARNKSGELFGFERTANIAMCSAEVITGAAQDFGQEDDITVLTLTRVPTGSTPQSLQSLSTSLA